MTERIMCRHIIADMLVNPAITHRPARVIAPLDMAAAGQNR